MVHYWNNSGKASASSHVQTLYNVKHCKHCRKLMNKKKDIAVTALLNKTSDRGTAAVYTSRA